MTNSLDFTKTIIPLALMASESIEGKQEEKLLTQSPFGIRALGIIVNYSSTVVCTLNQWEYQFLVVFSPLKIEIEIYRRG